MSNRTNIQWTDSTWNSVTGCTKLSAGCANCYAEPWSARLKGMGKPKYENEFQLTLHEDILEDPLKWKKPRKIFVNSMSDLFHEEVPDDFIRSVFETMERANWHTFQVLTKRSGRLREFAGELPWPKNVWMGVSVENQDVTHRIPDLVSTPAALKFISFEPLLESVGGVVLDGIDWVIVGGESGDNARPMAKEWVAEIRDQCIEEEIPFFFKQWSGKNKKKAGRVLDGLEWNEFPKDNAP